MKITIALTLSVLMMSACGTESQKNKVHKTDLQKENLKGKIKTIEQSVFDAVNKFGETTKGNRTYSGNYKTTYNENGNTIEKMNIVVEGA